MNIKLFNIGGKVKPLAREFKGPPTLQSLLSLIRAKTGDSGVKIVSFLKGESGAYIDTGIIPTKFDSIDLEFSDCAVNGIALGAGRSGYRFDFCVGISGAGKIALASTNGSNRKDTIIQERNVRYVAHCGDYLSVDGIVYETYTSRASAIVNTLGLFGWHSADSFINAGRNKTFAFVMTGEGGVILANYVPIVDSSGEGMMFDLVSEETKRTIGNPFTYGDVVESEESLSYFQKKSWGLII